MVAPQAEHGLRGVRQRARRRRSGAGAGLVRHRGQARPGAVLGRPDRARPAVDVAAAADRRPRGQADADPRRSSSSAPAPAAGAVRAARCSAPACGPVTAPTPRQALARETGAFGRSGHRPDLLPPACRRPWPGSAGVSGGPVAVSFKAAPKDVLSGRLDGQLSNWFATAPKDRPIYWSYFHEPENDVESGAFTTADYRAAWVHLAGAGRPGEQPAAAVEPDPHVLDAPVRARTATGRTTSPVPA